MPNMNIQRCWTKDHGSLTLTVVPDLRNSFENNTWLWTVRDRAKGYALLREGRTTSMEEARMNAERTLNELRPH